MARVRPIVSVNNGMVMQVGDIASPRRRQLTFHRRSKRHYHMSSRGGRSKRDWREPLPPADEQDMRHAKGGLTGTHIGGQSSGRFGFGGQYQWDATTHPVPDLLNFPHEEPTKIDMTDEPQVEPIQTKEVSEDAVQTMTQVRLLTEV